MKVRGLVFAALLGLTGCASQKMAVHHTDVANLFAPASRFEEPGSFPDEAPDGWHDVIVTAENYCPGGFRELRVTAQCGGQRLVLWDESSFGPGMDAGDYERETETVAKAVRLCAIRMPGRNYELTVNGKTYELLVEQTPRDVSVIFAPGDTIVRYEPSVPDGTKGEPITGNIHDGRDRPHRIDLAVSNYNRALGVARYSIDVTRDDGSEFEAVSQHELMDWGLPTNPHREDAFHYVIEMQQPARSIAVTDHLMRRKLTIDIREGDGQAAGIVILSEKRIGLLFTHPDGTRQVIDPDR